MNTAHSLDHAREALDRAIRDRGRDLPRFDPLGISPYVAMSLLQKAIRRDRVDLALGSAARLLDISPERLWRRLAVTAFEDLGVADLDTVALVMPGKIGKCGEVFLAGQDFRLEAPHLTGRSNLPFAGLTADNPPHERVEAEPVGIVHIIIPAKASENGLGKRPRTQIRSGCAFRLDGVGSPPWHDTS